jgi:hypothetical protein
MYRLYAYPDSSDLYQLEAELLAAFEQFVRSWPVDGVLLTNKKAPLMDGQEIPDWNLGLRVETAILDHENVEQLLSFLSELSRKVNLPFVLGSWQRPVGTRNLCFIDQHVPDGAAGEILEGAHAV